MWMNRINSQQSPIELACNHRKYRPANNHKIPFTCIIFSYLSYVCLQIFMHHQINYIWKENVEAGVCGYHHQRSSIAHNIGIQTR